MPAAERAEVLAALARVDAVVVFDELTAEGVVAAPRPEIHVKGSDYTEATLSEARVVRAYGGDVRLLSVIPSVSTTALVARIRAAAATEPVTDAR